MPPKRNTKDPRAKGEATGEKSVNIKKSTLKSESNKKKMPSKRVQGNQLMKGDQQPNGEGTGGKSIQSPLKRGKTTKTMPSEGTKRKYRPQGEETGLIFVRDIKSHVENGNIRKVMDARQEALSNLEEAATHRDNVVNDNTSSPTRKSRSRTTVDNAYILLGFIDTSMESQKKSDVINQLQSENEQLKSEKDQLKSENDQLQSQLDEIRKAFTTSDQSVQKGDTSFAEYDLLDSPNMPGSSLLFPSVDPLLQGSSQSEDFDIDALVNHRHRAPLPDEVTMDLSLFVDFVDFE